jgi:dynein heavy chain
MDHKGWYDRKEKDKGFRELRDLIFVAAMGPPGGGKNPVSPRYLRHFNIIAVNNFDDTVLNRIYSKLMQWHIKSNGYQGDIARSMVSIVAGSVDVFLCAQNELRPTPAKSHYLFNLRDLARVIHGVQMLNKNQVTDPKKIIRLWAHEVCRVFADRLVDDKDQEWLYDKIFKAARDKVKDDLLIAIKAVLEEKKIKCHSNKDAIRYICFADVMEDGISIFDRSYDEVTGKGGLT